MKRNVGKLNFNTVEPDPVVFNPFTTRVIKLPVRTVNVEITSQLPSKEGLNVASVISILYRVMPEKAPEVIANIGAEYEEAVIISVFRSASADVCSQFFAKDRHSSQRTHIEQAIASRMESLFKP
ncbi:SPFH domain-containing protein [Catalinimonas niigatensis]|uniref:SPFH domain-containing protein n=1 Tax=Catalinimonas niigatensis TaxID=1397264 RepID=UPI002AA2AEE7|nr:SPFH domain-containing protein [Catalinimonas niigatensis]WPP52031.1 SPFH domain-containing protein [Catalinimonas niigatensis]